MLGPKFFKTQLETLDMDEFLTSICAIRHKEVVNKFFAYYNKEKHEFSDSYIYESILKLDLKEHSSPQPTLLKILQSTRWCWLDMIRDIFLLDCCPRKKLWASTPCDKEFFCCYPDEQPELARQFL